MRQGVGGPFGRSTGRRGQGRQTHSPIILIHHILYLRLNSLRADDLARPQQGLSDSVHVGNLAWWTGKTAHSVCSLSEVLRRTDEVNSAEHKMRPPCEEHQTQGVKERGTSSKSGRSRTLITVRERLQKRVFPTSNSPQRDRWPGLCPPSPGSGLWLYDCVADTTRVSSGEDTLTSLSLIGQAK